MLWNFTHILIFYCCAASHYDSQRHFVEWPEVCGGIYVPQDQLGPLFKAGEALKVRLSFTIYIKKIEHCRAYVLIAFCVGGVQKIKKLNLFCQI